ncbi:DUF1336 domain containing protein [Nitzschia inconspicua]|uniref:DUF1336 domain containing protein n=1 Tax=Nitzschia inconspicua TaxID=303405 RepID=A0A9K3PLJ4_9STRA|nr:DUF1336 domain containing protein [Nitzschia inconspicua]
MDLGYFMCSVSTSNPVENTDNNTSTIEREHSDSRLSIASNKSSSSRRFPELLESSCSSSFQDSTAESVPLPPAIVSATYCPKPGETSPSSLLLNRRLSAALITNESERRHPVVEGRPVILTKTSSAISNETSSVDSSLRSLPNQDTNRKVTMAVVSKSSPTRPEHISDRSVSEKIPTASSMVEIDGLPFVDAKQDQSYDDYNEDGLKDNERILEEKKSEEDIKIVSSSTSPTSRPILRRSQTEPVERHPTTYRFLPPPLRTQAWSEPPAETFQVRGKSYMKDRVKVLSQPTAFRLFAVDLVNTEKPIYSGMCAHPQERIQLALQRELETGVKELPEFVFCVNLCVPGTINYHNVYYFGADKAIMEEVRNQSTPFGHLMHKFLYGDSNEFRNNTFKLIPRIVEGNYIVRRAVGTKPTILGRKIKQRYLMTDRYMEVLVDIASDPIAQRVTKLCMGYLQSMTVDMMFLLEGSNEKELPERVFGGARISGVDFKEQDGKRTVPLVY